MLAVSSFDTLARSHGYVLVVLTFGDTVSDQSAELRGNTLLLGCVVVVVVIGWVGCRERHRTAVNPSSLQALMKPAAGSATVGRQLS